MVSWPRWLASTWSMLMPPLQHGALLQRHARQDVAGLPGWMPTPVDGLLNRPVMKFSFVLERLQRLQALAQLHLGAGALGPPVVAVDAVAHEQHRQALGMTVGGQRADGARGQRRAGPGRQRLQPGQRHGHARPAQQRAPARRSTRVAISLPLAPVSSRPRLVRNWGLVTMLLDQARRSGSRRRPAAACISSMEGSSDSSRRAPQGVAEQLAAQVVDEVVLAVGAAGSRAARRRPPPSLPARERAPACPPAGRRDPCCAARRPGRSPRRPARTNRSGRGSRRSSVLAVLRQHLAQGQVAHLALVVGQVGHLGRRRRDHARPAPAAPPSSRA